MSEGKQNNDELGFITWMQVIGCVLVILGHSYTFVSDIPSAALSVRTFIYYFHMPLFVWCSGYLLAKTKQCDKYIFAEYVKRRFLRIIVPYFLFSLIGIVPKIALSSVLNDSLKINGVLKAFLVPRESIWGHFWFLPMIFFLGIIGYLVYKFIPRGGVLRIVVFVSSTAIGLIGFFSPNITGWFSLNDIVHYLLYLMVGVICGSLRINDWKKIWNFLFGFVAIIISILLFVKLQNTAFINLVISLLMIFAILTLSNLLSALHRINRSSAIAQTYSIFILSWPCQLVVEVIVERILNMSFYVVSPCMFVTGLVTPLLIIKFVDSFEDKTNTHFISLMIGR